MSCIHACEGCSEVQRISWVCELTPASQLPFCHMCSSKAWAYTTKLMELELQGGARAVFDENTIATVMNHLSGSGKRRKRCACGELFPITGADCRKCRRRSTRVSISCAYCQLKFRTDERINMCPVCESLPPFKRERLLPRVVEDPGCRCNACQMGLRPVVQRFRLERAAMPPLRVNE